MQGKRVLITGANGGIGKVTAMELAKLGAVVVVAARDSEKTRAAMQEIAAHGNAEHLPVDLASLDSVRALARAYLERHDRLDVLINNAGVFPVKRTLTQDGFEAQFGVNHLAHFLLTNELLNALKASAPSRVVTVTSKLHKNGAIDFASFRGEGKYSAQKAYGQSKLANVLFAVELAERLADTGVTSNALHPGAVRTDIMRSVPGVLRWLINLSFINVQEGAKTSIMLASDPALETVTGQYYDQCEPDAYSDLALDKTLRHRLWEESVAMTSG